MSHDHWFQGTRRLWKCVTVQIYINGYLLIATFTKSASVDEIKYLFLQGPPIWNAKQSIMFPNDILTNFIRMTYFSFEWWRTLMNFLWKKSLKFYFLIMDFTILRKVVIPTTLKVYYSITTEALSAFETFYF